MIDGRTKKNILNNFQIVNRRIKKLDNSGDLCGWNTETFFKWEN